MRLERADEEQQERLVQQQVVEQLEAAVEPVTPRQVHLLTQVRRRQSEVERNTRTHKHTHTQGSSLRQNDSVSCVASPILKHPSCGIRSQRHALQSHTHTHTCTHTHTHTYTQ